jgi:hypothetical protein
MPNAAVRAAGVAVMQGGAVSLASFEETGDSQVGASAEHFRRASFASSVIAGENLCLQPVYVSIHPAS